MLFWQGCRPVLSPLARFFVQGLSCKACKNNLALDLKRLDVVGFSLGGMIAQQLAFEYPDMIRRMILLGTGPRGGEGMTFSELSLDELKDPVALIMKSFFTPSENSQAAGRAYLKRLKLRAADRDAPVSMKSAGAQLDASGSDSEMQGFESSRLSHAEGLCVMSEELAMPF
jgi:pimeloyl-ACP methyl ester carboxylesterase